ncbi:alpha/beta hydrolase [Streptomonospora nanhaiensis]|uniref:Alpha-beta hydrolase superfamily lysophospholipase n=1 Tax=Streptomonospora nanhaiensis TaxID=1323731 RepID=A0A853BJE4_9ACTN|nr:alpha/beta hydrolase [Streptomonospora nanhaiensis]MBV2366162.1 lysophospholipase [Streptomonospora nanhaiensis]MBX9390502.1 lysophospholipase [Streptomonospora nanhaiensis]NYI94636.1 alpha-beta hydrolase superfamily lysophospholipase [Streptomonospora nanhaiensis]
MVSTREWELPGGPGGGGRLAARAWAPERGEPDWLAVLVHGYGEHIGRYTHVAEALCAGGAAVYGLDHRGHGRSSGERVLIEDFADVVEDVHRVVTQARTAYRTLPLVLVGHSMGGLIAARYAQLHGAGLAGLVLSGPVLGRWTSAQDLLAAAEIPDTPIDTGTLSRDPEVGRAYAADELVWHGPFKRPTLRAVDTELRRVTEHGRLDGTPLLWVHGSDDRLVPLSDTRVGIEAFAGEDVTARIFPGARHEVFNETNRDEVLAEVVRFARRCAGLG